MALAPCKECKAQISTDADTCPQCGAKQSKAMPIWAAALLIVGIASVLSLFTGSPDKPNQAPKTPEQLAAERESEREFQTVLAGVKWLRDTMKKPETFELLHASMVDGKVMCLQYKARNSWNDVAQGQRVITDNMNSGEARDWNTHCAGKGGNDYTYARAALDR